MAEDFGILFCLTCSTDLERPDVRAHQSQDHLVVRIAIVEDEATVQAAK